LTTRNVDNVKHQTPHFPTAYLYVSYICTSTYNKIALTSWSVDRKRSVPMT